MIYYMEHSDIFKANVQALVNPVNTLGVSGAGLALEFKNRFKTNQITYETACENKELKPGGIIVTKDKNNKEEYIIINFATKDHWKNPSHVDFIEKGLKELRHVIRGMNITSIAIPALGCGLGGLDWADVKKLIHKHLSGLPSTKVLVFEPH